jgi:hypothetical protein
VHLDGKDVLGYTYVHLNVLYKKIKLSKIKQVIAIKVD